MRILPVRDLLFICLSLDFCAFGIWGWVFLLLGVLHLRVLGVLGMVSILSGFRRSCFEVLRLSCFVCMFGVLVRCRFLGCAVALSVCVFQFTLRFCGFGF